MARYFKAVDRFNDLTISAFVSAGCIKLLLIHDGRVEEAVRPFFVDIYEAYVKARPRTRVRTQRAPAMTPAAHARFC